MLLSVNFSSLGNNLRQSCKGHLLVDASGKDKYMKASDVGIVVTGEALHCGSELTPRQCSRTGSLSCLCVCPACSAALKPWGDPCSLP